ncbi:MAG: acyltransferase 3, partial [Gemmatimonadetes bacterium]|nr:acyltransferase 3 [Gemmatimonadota bacterium]
SLAVEEQFYLLWPTVVFFARGRNLAWICGLLIVSATALRCHWSLQDVPWNRIYRLTITRWDTMAFGALAALALRSESYRERAARIAPTLVAAGTAAFLVLTVLAGGAEWSKGPIQTFGSTSASIAFAGLVLYAATRTSGPLYAVLCRPVLLSLGKYSYFIYVVHGLVISHVYWVGSYIMKRAPLSAVPLKLALFLLVNVGVFHVAKLSWRFFEAPVLKLKRHFEPRA